MKHGSHWFICVNSCSLQNLSSLTQYSFPWTSLSFLIPSLFILLLTTLMICWNNLLQFICMDMLLIYMVEVYEWSWGSVSFTITACIGYSRPSFRFYLIHKCTVCLDATWVFAWTRLKIVDFLIVPVYLQLSGTPKLVIVFLSQQGHLCTFCTWIKIGQECLHF